MVDRAKQFLSFDSLKGLKAILKEREKVIIEKFELLEDEKELLSYKIKQIKKGMMIKLIYFEDDQYLELEGLVSKISFNDKYVIIVKKRIDFINIYSVSGNKIKDYWLFFNISTKVSISFSLKTMTPCFLSILVVIPSPFIVLLLKLPSYIFLEPHEGDFSLKTAYFTLFSFAI